MRRIRILFAAASGAALLATLPAMAQQGPGSREDGRRGQDGAQRIEMILERFDANGDGQITQAEVDAAAEARFAEADANGDGTLSVEEMIARAEARRMERLTTRIERMVARLDTDGDGALSADEMAERRDGRFFDMLDADNDGVITGEELAERGPRGPGRFGMRDGHGHGFGPRGFDRF